MKVTKELLKKVYEDGQLFGPFVNFEEYYEEAFNNESDEIQ